MSAARLGLRAACALALALVGCGREVGRVPFSSEDTKRAELVLASGDVAFWTDIGLRYDGPATLDYRIDLLQGGVPVATTVCDPLGPLSVKLGWIEIERGRSRTLRGNGKMPCSVTLAKGGPTTVEVSLAFSSKPSALGMERADLVLRQ